jgi:uncharacterized protein (TIGR00251 family)
MSETGSQTSAGETRGIMSTFAGKGGQDSRMVLVKLRPQAKKDKIAVDGEGTIVVSVTSPPVEGKANAAAIRLLSKALHSPKSSIRIVRGATSRLKLIAVDGAGAEAVVKKLKQAGERI